MGIFSIVLIVIWASLAFDGVYAIVKGYFPREQKKAEKHEPNAYRKWIRFSGVFIVLCGVLNIVLNIIDAVYEIPFYLYIIAVVGVVVVVIAAVAIAYRLIVKPADEKIGIESEFSKALKESKNKEQ